MNKNGWGLRVELVFILMFLICLVIAIIGLNRFGLLGDNDNSLINQGKNNTFSYGILESKITASAKRYFLDYYDNELQMDKVIVRASTLYYNGYMEKLYDDDNDSCSGYVEVINVSGGLVYVPYIKCSNYKTIGYDESNDW